MNSPVKKTILIAIISIFIIALLIYFKTRAPEHSYISFENECIEAAGPLSEVVGRTVGEFPECIIISSGKFMGSDYMYTRCGNNALNTNHFVTFDRRNACDAFSGLDKEQQRRIVSGQ